MSRCHVSESELEAGCVLACSNFPESDLEITVIGKVSKNNQIGRETCREEGEQRGGGGNVTK